MEINLSKRVLFFTGRDSERFAEAAIKSIGQELSEVNIVQFLDEEIEPKYVESVRGAHIFIILSTNSPKNIMELALMIDAAKRASAAQVIAVIPYFGYARQDKKGQPRVSLGAKLLANIFEKAAGADSIVTMDFHADQLEGFFDIPVTHIFASAVFVDYIKENFASKEFKIATADTGGAKRAEFYSKHFGVDQVVAHKTRIGTDKVDSIIIIGDVKDCHVMIVEDIISTGGTICKASQAYLDAGALSVRALVSHGVFSGNAIEKIEKSQITEVVITDSITLSKKVKDSDKVKSISVANLFGSVMNDIAYNRSISGNLVEK